MARPRRKRRTREHVLADLSVHHIEGHVLRCGWVVERMAHDYGIDLELHTFDRTGRRDVAYWLYIQSYFRRLKGFSLFTAGETVTIQLPIANVVTRKAI